MNTDGLLEKARAITWQSFDQHPEYKPFHIFHTNLFITYSEQLLLRYLDLNQDIVRIASIMHDIARPYEDLGIIVKQERLNPHHVEGGRIAEDFLKKQGFNYAEEVAEVIRTHGGKMERRTPEAKAIYDCQRLSDTSPALYAWFIQHNHPEREIVAFFKNEFYHGERVPAHFEYSQRLFERHKKIMKCLIPLDYPIEQQ